MSTVETEPKQQSTSAPPPQSTTDDVPPPGHTDRFGIWFRRGFLCLLVVVVVLGVTGFLGVKSRTAQAHAKLGGTTLEVHYAQIARAGLDVPFEITVHKPGGFGGQEVTLAVSSSYLELFNRSSVDPEPSSSTADASQVQWTFDPPDGDTLVVSVDMQVQFGRHWGRAGTVSLLDDQGKPVVTTSIKTWLSP
jgi:hypothetical protein